MTRIGEYKIRPYGTRGLEISLPKVWADDKNVAPGDTVDFFRDDQDNLVIKPREQRDAS